MTHLDPELLSAYLDDQVSAAERATIERHLATCEGCRAELESLRGTVALLRQLPEVPLPRTFYVTEAMVAPPEPRARRWRDWLRALAPVGAAVAALLLVLVIVNRPGLTPATAPAEPEIALGEPEAPAEAAADSTETFAVEEEAAESAIVAATEAPPAEAEAPAPAAESDAADTSESRDEAQAASEATDADLAGAALITETEAADAAPPVAQAEPETPTPALERLTEPTATAGVPTPAEAESVPTDTIEIAEGADVADVQPPLEEEAATPWPLLVLGGATLLALLALGYWLARRRAPPAR